MTFECYVPSTLWDRRSSSVNSEKYVMYSPYTLVPISLMHANHGAITAKAKGHEAYDNPFRMHKIRSRCFSGLLPFVLRGGVTVIVDSQHQPHPQSLCPCENEAFCNLIFRLFSRWVQKPTSQWHAIAMTCPVLHESHVFLVH